MFDSKDSIITGNSRAGEKNEIVTQPPTSDMFEGCVDIFLFHAEV